MGTNPWDRHEGRFDRPSSGVPPRDVSPRRETAPPTPKRADYLKQRLVDAERQGVIATGTDTILQRIDAAMAALVAGGLGDAKAIYLTDTDLLAFREAHGGSEYRDVRIASGATSKVYSARGFRRVRRPAKVKS